MSTLDIPVTHYARSGDLNVAYQTMGDGPIDLIFVPGMITHVEFLHEIPGYTDFLRRLATFARVVTFDKSGQGLSDRYLGMPSFEQRVDDAGPSWRRSNRRAPSWWAALRAGRSASCLRRPFLNWCCISCCSAALHDLAAPRATPSGPQEMR
jgi:hypothetical protein